MTQYTAADILLIIAALGAVIVNAITAWRMSTKVDDIGKKTAVIEGHVNSKETKYVEQLASVQRENEILRNVINSKEQTAALLAQAVISRDYTQVPVVGPQPIKVEQPVAVVIEDGSTKRP